MFVLAYLSRYTHRVAISNARLITADADNVTFKVKDYRVEGPARYTTMTLRPAEFIRRFLLHVLPKGFHRIRQDDVYPIDIANIIFYVRQLSILLPILRSSITKSMGPRSWSEVERSLTSGDGGRWFCLRAYAWG